MKLRLRKRRRTRFVFMKDHDIVDSFSLKRPERIEALGYVLLLMVVLLSGSQ